MSLAVATYILNHRSHPMSLNVLFDTQMFALMAQFKVIIRNLDYFDGSYNRRCSFHGKLCYLMIDAFSILSLQLSLPASLYETYQLLP